MKRFLEIANTVFDWFMNLVFTAILFGGGAWCVWQIFFN